MIKGKTPEEIRKLFNIVNDFTPEEEVHSLLMIVESHTLNCFLRFLSLGANQEGERELRPFPTKALLLTTCSRNGLRTDERHEQL